MTAWSMIAFNWCKLNQCKTDVALMVVFSIKVSPHMHFSY